jgi:hypothetical protein
MFFRAGLVNPLSYLPLSFYYGLLGILLISIRDFEIYDRTSDYVSSLGGHFDEDTYDFVIGRKASVVTKRFLGAQSYPTKADSL